MAEMVRATDSISALEKFSVTRPCASAAGAVKVDAISAASVRRASGLRRRRGENGVENMEAYPRVISERSPLR